VARSKKAAKKPKSTRSKKPPTKAAAPAAPTSRSTGRSRTSKPAVAARRVAPRVDYGGDPATQPSRQLPPPSWSERPEQKRGKERRRQPRARAEFGVRLYGGDGRDTYLEARLNSADVSLSGIFLRSTFYLPVGASVRVEFDVPEVGRVEAHGVVRRVQPAGDETGIGIEFDSFEEGSLEALVSVFVADEVREFVEGYCRARRGRPDTPSPTSLLHGILAWELHRSGAHTSP